MQFKFTAKIVDEIERFNKRPIGDIASDSTITSLASVIARSQIDSKSGKIGCNSDRALQLIESYLSEGKKSTLDLMLDIMEALVKDGFLPKVNIKKTRDTITQKIEEASRE